MASQSSTSNTSGGLQGVNLSAISSGIVPPPVLKDGGLDAEDRRLSQDRGKVSLAVGGINPTEQWNNCPSAQNGVDLLAFSAMSLIPPNDIQL